MTYDESKQAIRGAIAGFPTKSTLCNAVAFFRYRADAVAFAQRVGGRVRKARGNYLGQWIVS